MTDNGKTCDGRVKRRRKHAADNVEYLQDVAVCPGAQNTKLREDCRFDGRNDSACKPVNELSTADWGNADWGNAHVRIAVATGRGNHGEHELDVPIPNI